MASRLAANPGPQPDPRELPSGMLVFGHPLPPIRRPLSPIVGRRKEMETATDLLTQGDFRLLTLTGPGGVGKTRLSLEIAHHLRGVMTDGVVFIDLSPVEDARLVLPAIASSLGVPAGDTETLLPRLAQAIGDAHVLLVLDNLEQVIVAGVEIAGLLARCPHASALVTSRMPLRVQGEQELSVPTFTDPSMDRVATNDAIELFVQRAQAARREFALTPETAPDVAEICARLDGLPLAIELAAARTKLFSPADLLHRLSDRMALLTGGPRDLPSRLQTMRDAIQWSYDLLSAEDQAAFRRLALFSGSFSLDVAMDVIEPPVADGAFPDLRIDTLDAIATLIDHSLVLRDDGPTPEARFRMLETIRAFGIDELRAHREAPEIERRMVRAFAIQVTDAAEALIGPEQTTWLQTHDRNVANFRLSLQLSLDAADPALTRLGLGMASNLWRYWLIRGHISEGASWLERLLARVADVSAREMAEALNNHGNLLLELGQLDYARDRYERSKAQYESFGDREGIGDELNNLGLVRMLQGDFAEAKGILETCLAIRHELNDVSAMPTVLSNLGDIATIEERYDDAEQFNLEGYRIRKERGNLRGMACSCHALGLVAYYRGEHDAATAWFDEGTDYASQIDDAFVNAMLKVDRGMVAVRREHMMDAMELSASALHVLRQTGSLRMMAEAFDNIVAVSLATGHDRVAARLLGGTQAMRDEHGIAFTTRTRQDFAMVSARLTQALGEKHFVAEFDAGQAMDIDELVEEELGLLAALRAGGLPVTQDVSGSPVAKPSVAVDEGRLDDLGLTRREREVLVFLVHGLSDKDIAERLSISPRTAMTHVGNVMGKLGVNRRASAATIALRDRLVDPAAPIPAISA
ncbi:MAG: tetratricopeptide repeat protein [Thermomicrobiales bacterium]